jgi:hypothetical protein
MLNNKKQILLSNSSDDFSKISPFFCLPNIPNSFLRFSISNRTIQNPDFLNDFNFLIANVRQFLNCQQLRPFFPYRRFITLLQRKKRRKILRLIKRLLRNLSHKRGAARFSVLFAIVRLRHTFPHYYSKKFHVSRSFKNYRGFNKLEKNLKKFHKQLKSHFSTFKLTISSAKFESFLIFKRFKFAQLKLKKDLSSIKVKKYLNFVVWLSKLKQYRQFPMLRLKRFRLKKKISIFYKKRKKRKKKFKNNIFSNFFRDHKKQTTIRFRSSSRNQIFRKNRNCFYNLKRKKKRKHGFLVTFLGKKAFILKRFVKFSISRGNILPKNVIRKNKKFVFPKITLKTLKKKTVRKKGKKDLREVYLSLFEKKKKIAFNYYKLEEDRKIKKLERILNKKSKNKTFFSNKSSIKNQTNLISCRSKCYLSLRSFFFLQTKTLFKRKLTLKVIVF